MNMFDVIRDRNMRELEEIRALRQDDPTYNRVAVVKSPVELDTGEAAEVLVTVMNAVAETKVLEAAPKPAKVKREKK